MVTVFGDILIKKIWFFLQYITNMGSNSKRVKINFETINRGNYTIIEPSEIAEINKRIKSEMDPIIKDFERKERLSYQQANKIKK